MQSHNGQDLHFGNDDPRSDIPEAIDGERSPQYNELLNRSQYACACAPSRCAHRNEPDMVDEDVPMSVEHAGSDDGTGSVAGDEGLEDHQIELGPFGHFSLRAILLALAHEARCACHRSHPADDEDYPFSRLNSPALSYLLSPDSMLVEPGGGEDSALASSLTLSWPGPDDERGAAGSPSASLAYIGSGFDGDRARGPPLSATANFTGAPVWLAHERDFCLNMDIGARYGLRYPVEIGGEDGSSGEMSEVGL